MREIILPHTARCFQDHGWALGRTDRCIRAGTRVSIGPVEIKHYDHRDQDAVPCAIDGEFFYLLVDEAGLPNVVN